MHMGLLYASAVCIAGATVVLLVAILRQDFGLSYVATHSRSDSSPWYRVAALWSGAEGSLLFFAAMLAVVVAFVNGRGAPNRLAWVTGSASLALLTTTVLTVANPFARAAIPAVRGAGLTPILEHPAMIYHPPILYAGLVATAGPFLCVISGAGSLAVARRWTMASWTLLTVGLATGANWAYVELGWGGYWAWDPVENTVLMPWLVMTAALHAAPLDVGQAATARAPSGTRSLRALLGAPFVLVAFGSAVTRSGGLSSVHVFADAESIGIALGLWVVGVGAALAWHVGHHPIGVHEDSTERSQIWWLRVRLTAAVGFMLLLTLVVVLGVVFPLAPGNDRILESSYYTSIGAPLLAVALFALGLAATSERAVPQVSDLVRLVGGAIAGGLIAVLLGGSGWFALVSSAGIGAAIGGHLRRSQLTGSKRVMTLAHVGMILLSIGIVASSQARSLRTLLEPGQALTVAGHDVTYRSFAVSDGPRIGSEQSTALVTVSGIGGNKIELRPGLVSYPDRAVVLAETSLHSSPWRDVQVVMRAIGRDGAATFDISVRPGVMMVWWGAALIAFAGAVAGMQRSRRTRIGGPEAPLVRPVALLPLSGQQGVEG